MAITGHMTARVSAEVVDGNMTPICGSFAKSIIKF
jgi:hypothetical protein